MSRKEKDFDAGYSVGINSFKPDEPIGEPVGSRAFCDGWRLGTGHALAFYNGFNAYHQGVSVYHYPADSTAELLFRECWLDGYRAAMEGAA